MGNEILEETDANGSANNASFNQYIYFDGQRVARRDSSSNVFYYVEDMLGSSHAITTSVGVVCYDADFYPFGGERTITNTCPQNYKFTGRVSGFVLANADIKNERDAESGNDDFGARYYSSRLGRWLSADWSAIPVPVPYANLTNPQTLNLYAMVADDPETFADLDGHQQPCHTTSEGSCSTVADQTSGASPGAPEPGKNDNKNEKKDDKAQNQSKEDRLTNVTYNETGSLSGNPKAKPAAPGSAEELHTARVEVAEVAERVLESPHPEHVQVRGTLTAQTQTDLAAGNKRVIEAHNDSQSAARSALGGSNLSHGAMHYRTSHHIIHKLYGKKAAHFGPFRDALGGKTYIMVAP